MSETALKTGKGEPIKVQDEPWRVMVRHTMRRREHKSRLVTANSRESAWRAFLDEGSALLVEANYKGDPQVLPRCKAWLRAVKKDGIPEGTDIQTEDYLRRRLNAIRIRGTVRREEVDGFAELASA